MTEGKGVRLTYRPGWQGSLLLAGGQFIPFPSPELAVVDYWGPEGDPEVPGVLRHELSHWRQRKVGLSDRLKEAFEGAGLGEAERGAAVLLYGELIANYEQMDAGGSLRRAQCQFMSYAEPVVEEGSLSKRDIALLDASARRLLGWTGKSIIPRSWRGEG